MIFKTIFKFIKNVLSFKKKEYFLTFVKKHDNLWYTDIPQSDNLHNRLIIGSFNELLEFLDPFRVTISYIPSENEIDIDGYFKLKRIRWGQTEGAVYQVENLNNFSKEVWIYPNMLHILKRYPKFIYIKNLLIKNY